MMVMVISPGGELKREKRGTILCQCLSHPSESNTTWYHARTVSNYNTQWCRK